MRGLTSVLAGAVFAAALAGAASGAAGAKQACAGHEVKFVNGTRFAMVQLQVRVESESKWTDILSEKRLGIMRSTEFQCIPAGKFYEVRAVFQDGANVDKKRQALPPGSTYVVKQF
jgi:hypothetical protein